MVIAINSRKCSTENLAPNCNITMRGNSSNVLEKTPTSDIVEIENKNKTNKSTLLKKVGLYFGGISAIAIAAAYCIKKHQVKDIKNITKTFNDVFMRNDISEKEAKEILKRYKDIEKIKDRDEYIEALFKEVKNNFGFKESPITLTKELGTDKYENAYGWCASDNSLINISPKCPRNHILNTMHHEFRHAKQNVESISKDELSSFWNEFSTNLIKDDKLDLEIKYINGEFKYLDKNGKEIADVIGYIIEHYPKEFDKHLANYLKGVSESKQEYVKKLVISHSKEHNHAKDYSKYFNAFHEKDARDAGAIMKKYIRSEAFSFDMIVEFLSSKIYKQKSN